MNAAHPPLVVIGMHRSGTTLITQLLQRAGMFMGVNRDRNEEARFTRAVNAWWFRQASATWDHPEPLDDLLADEALRPWLLDYVDGIMRGPASLRFLGPHRYIRWPGLHRLNVPWGWKDPCNTYTLPLWLQLLPEARVVHVVRHGVDVAASLKARRRRALAANLARYQRRRRLYLAHPFAPKRRGFGPQPRCATLEGGFKLWEAYVERGRQHVAELEERAMEIRFETLLAEPETVTKRLLTFAHMATDPESVGAAMRGLDADRSHAWRQDSERRAFAERMGSRLERQGYGEPE